MSCRKIGDKLALDWQAVGEDSEVTPGAGGVAYSPGAAVTSDGPVIHTCHPARMVPKLGYRRAPFAI